MQGLPHTIPPQFLLNYLVELQHAQLVPPHILIRMEEGWLLLPQDLARVLGVRRRPFDHGALHQTIDEEAADLDTDRLRPLRSPFLSVFHVTTSGYATCVQVVVGELREEARGFASANGGHLNFVLLTHLGLVLVFNGHADREESASRLHTAGDSTRGLKTHDLEDDDKRKFLGLDEAQERAETTESVRVSFWSR